jgi:CTP synthase
MYIHVTFLPYIGATRELKTKPTQHSVRDLRQMGIQPQMIIARSDYPVSRELLDKIALFCDVDMQAVIPLATAQSIYEVPLLLEDEGVGDYIVSYLELKTKPSTLDSWRNFVQRLLKAEKAVQVAIVGKYVQLHDAYMSVKEALTHAAAALDRQVEITWIDSVELEKGKHLDTLEKMQGIIVPGGFGPRGIEGKIMAARLARERKIPYLGLCLGMQIMCIEFARQVMHLEDAHSTEFEIATENPVIDLMNSQKGINEMGGTMRLGLYPCQLTPGSLAERAYGKSFIQERHRHRWEVNNTFREAMQKAGLRFSGLSPDGQLVEIAEVVDHPFMVGSQFHPEFTSRPDRPQPLFKAFVEAILAQEGKN